MQVSVIFLNPTFLHIPSSSHPETDNFVLKLTLSGLITFLYILTQLMLCKINTTNRNNWRYLSQMSVHKSLYEHYILGVDTFEPATVNTETAFDEWNKTFLSMTAIDCSHSTGNEAVEDNTSGIMYICNILLNLMVLFDILPADIGAMLLCIILPSLCTTHFLVLQPSAHVLFTSIHVLLNVQPDLNKTFSILFITVFLLSRCILQQIIYEH